MGKGGARKGAGRPKGVPNRVTREVREVLRDVIGENVPRLRSWLAKDTTWEREGVAAARLLTGLLEYAAPKLTRTDSQAVTKRSIEDFTDAELEVLMRQAEEAPAPQLPEEIRRDSRFPAPRSDFAPVLAPPDSSADEILKPVVQSETRVAVQHAVPSQNSVDAPELAHAREEDVSGIMSDETVVAPGQVLLQEPKSRERQLAAYRADLAAWEMERAYHFGDIGSRMTGRGSLSAPLRPKPQPPEEPEPTKGAA